MSGQESRLESVVGALPMINERIFVHMSLLKIGMAALYDARQLSEDCSSKRLRNAYTKGKRFSR